MITSSGSVSVLLQERRRWWCLFKHTWNILKDPLWTLLGDFNKSSIWTSRTSSQIHFYFWGTTWTSSRTFTTSSNIWNNETHQGPLEPHQRHLEPPLNICDILKDLLNLIKVLYSLFKYKSNHPETFRSLSNTVHLEPPQGPQNLLRNLRILSKNSYNLSKYIRNLRRRQMRLLKDIFNFVSLLKYMVDLWILSMDFSLGGKKKQVVMHLRKDLLRAPTSDRARAKTFSLA